MHPQAGSIVRGSGGIRKLRWAKGNKGKSGGVRVIYFYHDPRMPLFLLTLFSKSERKNLTKADMNGLRQMVNVLITNQVELRCIQTSTVSGGGLKKPSPTWGGKTSGQGFIDLGP
ncbi:type II toxin-antitoxin system RelE/ParE family toxin [Pelodictyon luteolum]|uniref:type II toxin-antitoxin system RelE/ParE family toxin n=1 Tax=Pelodictyon luteolum TaxID=1100 RepID=UPI00350E3B87